jgi:glyoxylase-like metal-dependent hydrolase (beta-lactamase superfamily II)
MLTRRHALAAGGVGIAWSLAGCAFGSGARGELRAQAVAPGVYMLPGSGGAADEHNLGRIGNVGFIVGPSGVIVIDTGTSLAHGREVLAAVRRVTPLPVRLALVTHTRPEFLFGGMAFKEAGIPVAMHRRGATLMASRCETCLKTLRHTVGEAPLAGTAMYKPDQEFDESHTLDLIGRPVRVIHLMHSSGPGDIAVLDVDSAVLFAGGLLDAGRVPDIQDSQLGGWRRGLKTLAALPLARIVPGHGPVSGKSLVQEVDTYLVQLEAKVRGLLKSGVSLLEVAEAAELPPYTHWDQYETIHRRNASVAYLRFEREQFLTQEKP